jgi:hypothetical protein
MASPMETTTTHSRCESPMTCDDDNANSQMVRDTQRITEVSVVCLCLCLCIMTCLIRAISCHATLYYCFYCDRFANNSF